MPFHIIRNDITRMQVDAVVNAANPGLQGGGGVDGAIHRAAGPELQAYCKSLGGCGVGEAKLSPGFDLPAKWIIHTVGPVWCQGSSGEAQLLASCYRSSLTLAHQIGCASVAFPLISAGSYGYPKDLALDIAVREIGDFLLRQELEVYLVVYDDVSYQLSTQRFSEIRSYLDRCLPQPESQNLRRNGREAALQFMRESAALSASAPTPCASTPPPAPNSSNAMPQRTEDRKTGIKPHSLFKKRKNADAETYSSVAGQVMEADASNPAQAQEPSLEERLRRLDESFSQMLLRLIDERGMTDAACYKRANIDRKLFSKIRSDPFYRPSKPTAIAFAISLELTLPEAKDLLMKAGFALSHSNKFDVIVEYFILHGNYNIFEINQTLFAFDQNLLGA